MLSQDAIDKLIQPLVDRQEKLNTYVVGLIAKRIKEIGSISPSDVHKLEQLFKSGSDVKRINSEIAKITGLQVTQIKKIIRAVAMDAYKDAKPFYDYRKKSYIPFEKNESLQRVVKSIAKQTSESYVNLSRSRAFMIRDLKNPEKLIATPLTKAYYSVVDEAITASQQGVVDYSTAMRRTMKQLADSGIRTIDYHPESGKLYTQSMEAAVKRNVLDGIRQINQGVQDEVGKQYGADGKEISVHEHSAPDHEPVQGHQFSNEEFDKLQNAEPFRDVNGVQFGAIERAIGTYNCHHITFSIIIGVNKPNFTPEELQQSIDRNNKGYTDSKGRHYTLYECSQKQREMERGIRNAKKTIMAGRESGDSVLEKQGKSQLSQRQKDYTAFSKACGLPKKPLNVRVEGFKA